MATIKLAVLAVACVSAFAFPQEPTGPVSRNTIFADEKFEGGIFENLDSMEQLELSRNIGESSLYRLPNTTRPVHYNVLWQINIAALAMSGSVDIQLACTQSDVSEIVIHGAEMTIGAVTLIQGTTNIPVQVVLEPETHFIRIRLVDGFLSYNPTSPVIYTLSTTFNAPLRTDMYGIYQSWFRNDPNNPNEAVR